VNATSDPTTFVRDAMPLCATLGVTASELTADRVVLELAWRAELCTVNGVLHGGAIMVLADSAAAVLAFLNLGEGARGTTTVETHTNLLGAVRDGRIRASARTLHVGSSTIVVEVETTAPSGRLVAKTSQTQLVLR
jgi:1,4-dihydroxy-2-naphthoyl-CoA hydrolase